MKKFIITFLVVISSGLLLGACTEEDIKPSSGNGGGVFEEPVKR